MYRSVKLYQDEIEALLELPEEQCAHVLRAVLCDCMGMEIPELDSVERMAFRFVNGQVKRAEELSRKRSKAAKARYAKNDDNSDNSDE